MFPIIFGFLFLNHQKREIRKSVKQVIYQKLDLEDISCIKLGKNQLRLLNWHHQDEFELDGRMYDVIDSSFMKDTVVYHCFWDRKESEINLKIDALALNFWNHAPVGGGVESSFVDFVKKLYPGDEILSVKALINVQRMAFMPLILNFPIGFLEISAPPPKFS